MTKDEVIATIQKLLNVTVDRGATEGEAANAAAAAQRLLLQHGLSMEEVGSADPAERTIVEEEIGLATKGIAWWQVALGNGIEHFFGVRLMHCRENAEASTILVIGRQTEAILAKWLFVVLQLDIRRKCREQLANVRHLSPRERRHFSEGFCDAAAQQVGLRLLRARREAFDGADGTNALVVRADREIDDFIAAKYDGVGETKARPRMKSRSGLLAGAAAGDELSIAVNAIEPRPEPAPRLR